MLDKLRKSTSGIIGIALIALLVMAFAVWGIADTFTGFGRQNIAEVGEQKITRTEFIARYAGQIRQMSERLGTPLSATQAEAYNLHFQTLASILASSALTQTAHDLGLGIGESTIANQIITDPAFQGISGQFDESAFRNVLRDNGLTEELFVRDQSDFAIREQMLTASLEQSLVPTPLLDSLYDYFLEQRVAGYIILTPALLNKTPSPSDTEVENFYKENIALYTQPERRIGTAIILSPKSFATIISISKEEIKEEYDYAIAEFSTPERRAINQLVLTDETQIEKARSLLTTKTPFAEIVNAVGQALEQTDLGELTYDGLLSFTLADAAFALEKGEISQIIDGPLGAVILRVREIMPAEIQPLEDVQETLHERLALARASDDIISITNDIEDARAGGATLQEIAARFSLVPIEIDIDNRGRDKNGTPIENDFLTSILFSAISGEEIPLNERSDGSFVWAELQEIESAKPRPFTEVKTQAHQDLADERKAQGLRALGLELTEFGNTQGFDAIEKRLKKPAIISQSMTRNIANDVFSKAATAKLFALPRGKFDIAPVGFGQELVLFQARDIITPKKTDKDSQQIIFDGEQRKFRSDMLDQFIETLQAYYGISVDETAFLATVREAMP